MQTALITGCSSGIGAAAVRRFAAEGWAVAATMRDPAQGAALKEAGEVEALALDVTDKASIARAVADTLARFGRIDVLVNNAGYGLFGPFETAGEADIEKQFATNLFGLFDVTRAVLPAMRAQKSGVIVNVASIGGLTTFPMNSLYHATKFAVVGFSESLNFELAPFNVRVKVVCPGGVATDFAGRSLATTFKDDDHPYADDVAKAIAAFGRNRARYSSAESIADGLYRAATDGSRKIRYVLGDDAIAMAAGKAQMTDEQYVGYIEGWLSGQ